jgi:hypothetical protein
MMISLFHQPQTGAPPVFLVEGATSPQQVIGLLELAIEQVRSQAAAAQAAQGNGAPPAPPPPRRSGVREAGPIILPPGTQRPPG